MLQSLALLWALTAQPQDFRDEARKLNERVQEITSRIGVMREKKLVHADALTEVEAFLQTITRDRGNLEAQAKEIDERRVVLQAKKKEVESLEKAYRLDQDAYNTALKRHNAQLAELNRRSSELGAEIDRHNARKDDPKSPDETDTYNQNAERLNGLKNQLQGEINQFNSVQVPAINEQWAQVERKRKEFSAVQNAGFDLEERQQTEEAAFRATVDTMVAPTEELYSILEEAWKKTGATAAYRVFADDSEAAAGTLAEAYGAAPDLPEETLRDTFVIRRAKDRTTTRVYIIEKLRLGEAIETLRGLRAAAVEQTVSADRLLDSAGPAAVVSKPCSLAKGKAETAWSFGTVRLQPQAQAALRRP